MKTEEELKQFYTDILAKKLDEMEELRQDSRRNYIIFIICIPFFIWGLIIYTGANKPEDFVVPAVFFCPILFFVFLFISAAIRGKYRNTFKKEIVGEMVKFYDSRLEYTPDKGVMADAIRISNIFYDVDEAGASDYVEGQLGETYIQFSKILTSDKNFSGIFMIVAFNKYFNGSYYVMPRKYATGELIFNKTMSKMDSDVPGVIDLENPDFEQEFAVFGSDGIEARYILTPLFMDKMLEFRKEVKNDFYVSFTRSRMFLAFGTKSYDIFEPSLNEETTLPDIEEWGKALQLAIGIVDEFGLNTRIWSKK